MTAAMRTEPDSSTRLTRTFWFGFRIPVDTTCAPTTDRLTSRTAAPSTTMSRPSRITMRGARRVPRTSSDCDCGSGTAGCGAGTDAAAGTTPALADETI